MSEKKIDWKDIDTYRKIFLFTGEWIDAWRLVPRLLVAGYAWMVYIVVKWYMNLQPYILENCDLGDKCLVVAPTTQHAALVTAVVGIAAAVFGLYSGTGRKWNGLTLWNKKKDETGE